MTKTSGGIKVDDLANAVMEGLLEYADLAADDMKSAVKKAGKSARDDIENNAPKNTGRYAKSWKTKITKETSDSIEVTIYSPGRYQIAHLLENGHAKRGGGRVKAIPHIKPAEEKAIKTLEDEVKRALGG